MTGSARSRVYHCTLSALVILTIALMAPPRTHAQMCVGDCNNSSSVTPNELVTLMSIALGEADASSCLDGIPSGSAVAVPLLLQAVDSGVDNCTAAPAVCGNGKKDTGEDCDNGGTCIGGTNAGTHCTAESQCTGDGICVDGPKSEWACSSNADCPSGACVHCKPLEGNGCAANCTTESEVNFTLVPGKNPPGDLTTLVQGTSGLIVNSGVGITVGIPFPPDTQRQLTIGKEQNGKIPFVLKSAGNQTPAIQYSTGLACICVRPVIFKTCGGTLWEKDGTPSTNCTAGYTAGDSVCPATKPCTLTYGADNIGEGSLACDARDGLNVLATQDSGGATGTAGPVLTTLSGAGGQGSAIAYVTTELGFVLGPCTGSSHDYGDDHMFCTTDDPILGRGVLAQALTTGTADAMVFNADQTDGFTVVGFQSVGTPVMCSALSSGTITGAALAGGFPELNAPTVMDITINTLQVAQ